MQMAAAIPRYGNAGRSSKGGYAGLARIESMFGVYAGIVLLGMLFGIPAAGLDVLLIFTVCLVGGLVFVALAARRIEELASYPGLVMGACCLHLAWTVAMVRSVTLNDGQAGRIAAVVASRLGDLSSVILAVVFLCIAGVSLAGILAAVRHVRVQAVFNMAVLNGREYVDNPDATARTKFNTQMGWAAKYIVLDAVTSVVLLCIAVACAGVMGAMTTLASHEGPVNHIAAAVAAGIATIIPMITLAVAAARLMTREFVICKAAARAGTADKAAARAKDTPAGPSAVKEAVFDEPGSVQAEREYQRIAQMLLDGAGKKAKVILMAARSSVEMGVTVPVNVAAKLAQRKQRCLIVDMDTSRDALAKAFDIGEKQGPVRTCIRGLYAWGAGSFCNNAAPAAKKFEAAQKHFDRIIIYWPGVGGGQGHDDVVQAAGAAVFFGRQGVEMAVLEAKLVKRGSVILR
jgi:hypothetical protein